MLKPSVLLQLSDGPRFCSLLSSVRFLSTFMYLLLLSLSVLLRSCYKLYIPYVTYTDLAFALLVAIY